MSSSAKAAMIVIVSFVAGLFIGVAADRFVLIRSGQLYPRRAMSFAASHLADRMKRDLDLTDAQKEQVQRIIDQHHTRIEAAWNGARPQVRKEMDAATAEIEAILTPAQRAKFTELRAKAEKRRGRRGMF